MSLTPGEQGSKPTNQPDGGGSMARELRYSIGVELARFSEHPSLISMDRTTDIIQELTLAYAHQAVLAERARLTKSMALWRATAGALHDQILEEEKAERNKEGV